MLWRDRRGIFGVTHQFVFCIADVHRAAREYIRWTYKDRIANALGKIGKFLNVSKTIPLWLTNVERVEQVGKLVAVLGTVNVSGIGAEKRNTIVL